VRIEESMARKAGKAEPVAEEAGRSALKRRAVLDAATGVFLKGGYLGTNMDEIAALSGVSKQTVYKHFASKEALFVEIVRSITGDTGDKVHDEAPDLAPDGDVAAFLEDYAYRQLSTVLTPQVMQLRRLVIGEVGRFPELARELYEGARRHTSTGW
jgi:TetR/AcrR family transcriptional repressor of mexJK operon